MVEPLHVVLLFVSGCAHTVTGRPVISHAAGAPSAPSPRPHTASLLTRVFIADAVVLVLALLALTLLPISVSVPIELTEFVVLLVGMVALLVLNLALVRRALAPLATLTHTMDRVDLLEPGRRVDLPEADRDVQHLASAFNTMLERLEGERRDSAEMALTVQEGERQRIARELHDEVGQTLTAMLLQVERVYRQAPEQLRDELDEMRETARSGAEDVRRIAQRLRPEALEELGLPSALLALGDAFGEQTGVRLRSDIARDLRLSAQQELVVYRVAQEALTNIARHADARHAQLELGADAEAVTLVVSDDGRGFDPQALQASYGIRGMRERALLIGAQLRLRARPAGGTEVRLRIPLETAGDADGA
jgi:two-component system sensor histidine kinase UhpB